MSRSLKIIFLVPFLLIIFLSSPTFSGEEIVITPVITYLLDSNDDGELEEPPVANAGPDQTVTDTDNNGSESITLDGSASSDPDNDIASYEWFEGQQSLGTGVTLEVDLAVGTHSLTLVVTDSVGNTDQDTVIITVTAGP